MVRYAPISRLVCQVSCLFVLLCCVGISSCSVKQQGYYQVRFFIDSDSEIETETAYLRVRNVVDEVLNQCQEGKHATPITRKTMFSWTCSSSRGTGIRIRLNRTNLGEGKRGDLYVHYSSGETVPFREKQWRIFFGLEDGLNAAFPDAIVHTQGRSVYDLVATKDISKIHEQYNLPLTDRAKERLASGEV